MSAFYRLFKATFPNFSLTPERLQRNTFSLNIKTQKVVDFLDREKARTGESKTAIINKLLEVVADWPAVLICQEETSSVLGEMRAARELLSDKLLDDVPPLSISTRRTRVQMLLHLIEEGKKCDAQVGFTGLSNVLPLKTPVQNHDKEYSAIEHIKSR